MFPWPERTGDRSAAPSAWNTEEERISPKGVGVPWERGWRPGSSKIIISGVIFSLQGQARLASFRCFPPSFIRGLTPSFMLFDTGWVVWVVGEMKHDLCPWELTVVLGSEDSHENHRGCTAFGFGVRIISSFIKFIGKCPFLFCFLEEVV